MIPNRVARSVESSPIEQSAEFSISLNDSAHVMNILRDTLYTDRILAVLREYSSNAWDAHRESGQPDRPIKVVMPTTMDPTLTIRDFGRGLSRSDVFTIYTKYGASTKRNDDNAVGMLGIGSKSGFAYSDSFTIISHYGGTKSTYVAVLDKSEKGVINLLHEEPTDETGVAIQIAVRPEDICEFEHKAQTFYMYFKPLPDINIKIPILPTTQANLVHGAVYDSSELCGQYGNGWVAVMGCVPYNINLYKIQDVNDDTLRTPSYLRNMSGALYFNIGDVQVSASREELKYGDDTKKAIVRKFELLIEEYVRHTLDEIAAKSTSQWDGRVRAQVLSKLGIPIPDSCDVIMGNRVAISPLTPAVYTVYHHKEMAHSIVVHKDVRLILRDDNRALVGYGLGNHDYVLSKDPKCSWDDVEAKLKTFCLSSNIDGIPIIKMSTMTWTKPIRGSYGKEVNEKHKQKMFKLANKITSYGAASDNWESISHTPTKDDVFVILSHFETSGYDICECVRKDRIMASAFGATLPPVYGYKTTSKKPIDNSNCVGKPYLQWRQEYVKSLLTDNNLKLIEAYAWSELVDSTYYDYYNKSNSKYKYVINTLGKNHKISQFFIKCLAGRKLFNSKDYTKKEDAIKALANLAAELAPPPESDVMLKAIGTTYPLLSIDSLQTLFGTNKDLWFDYIKMIDAHSGNKE
jgi:hypothetical protein